MTVSEASATTQEEQAMFPLKIKVRKATIECLKATAIDTECISEGKADLKGPYKILDRYTSQIVIQDENERVALLAHIKSQHGIGSTNGIPKDQRNKVASIIHALHIAAASEENETIEEIDMTISEAPKKTGTKAERSAANKILEKAQEIVNETLSAFEQARQDTMTIAELNEEAAAAISEDPKTNEFGVKSTVLDAAGFALQGGRITQAQYRLVCQGEITLDEAVTEAKAFVALEAKNPRTAKANPDKRSTKKPAKAKAPAKARVVPTWEIVLLDESGEVKQVLYEAITAKDLLALKGIEKDTGKVSKMLATDHGFPVRMTNSTSGRFYIKKPAKAEVAVATK